MGLNALMLGGSIVRVHPNGDDPEGLPDFAHGIRNGAIGAPIEQRTAPRQRAISPFGRWYG
jgi:hypothetical protein